MAHKPVSLASDGVFISNIFDEYIGENIVTEYADAGVADPYYDRPSGYNAAGAPGTTIGTPAAITIPKTLSVTVDEQLRVNSGDAQSTSTLFAQYADNRGAGDLWADVQAVYADNNVVTTVVLGNGETSAQLLLGNFDVNIPETATLLGVEVEVDRRVLQGSVTADALSSIVCEFVAPIADYTSDTYLKDAGFGSFTWNSGGGYWEADDVSFFGVGGLSLAPVGDEAGWVTTAGQPTSISFDWAILGSSAFDVDNGSAYLHVFPFGSSTPTLRKTVASLYITAGNTQEIVFSSIGWVAGDTFAGIGFRADTNDEGILDMRFSNLLFTA